MADPVYENNVIRFTESGLKEIGHSIRAIGARLVAGASADARADLYDGTSTSANKMAGFAAAQKTADEMSVCFNADSGTIYVELSGTGAELFVYLK
jgi:hypothetical protein